MFITEMTGIIKTHHEHCIELLLIFVMDVHNECQFASLDQFQSKLRAHSLRLVLLKAYY